MSTKTRILFATLLFVVVLSPIPGLAQGHAFQQRFDTVLAQHGIVGGGIAIVHGQDPATEFFIGVMRNGTHQRVDGETSYNWASITKTMTAIAILQLRDRGKLSLNDPAVRYVPELRQVHDEFGPIDAVTIRDLLTHSAGFRNPTWPWDCDDPTNCDWQPFEPTHWAQVVAMLPYTHVAFRPGTQWSYSNLGYVFLGQIIERLSGDDFEDYIEKNILMPLGMTASYFDRSPYFLESHVSASYLRSGQKLTEQPFNFDTGITTSNSGLKAPITDMVKYLRFLIGDPSNPIYDLVLKRSSLEQAWTGVVPVTQQDESPTAYTKDAPKMGLGFFVLNVGGQRYVYHDGDQGGFSSEMFIDPARHVASIFVVNTTDTGGSVPSAALHPQSNTEPEPGTDLRLTLRQELIDHVFPSLADTHSQPSPDLFRAKIQTTAGNFVIEVHRAWSPHGADRFYELVRNGYYNNSRFFRVVPGRWVQFGISGNPRTAEEWRHRVILDDPLVQHNTPGFVAFANTGPNTRSTEVYINTGDNSRNDNENGFAPFGRVVEGMDIVEKLYGGYGEHSGGGMRAGHQDAMFAGGNAYLDYAFPKLDKLISASVLP